MKCQNGTAGARALLLAECATGSRREVPTHALRFTLLFSQISEISAQTAVCAAPLALRDPIVSVPGLLLLLSLSKQTSAPNKVQDRHQIG
ncbi:hypothetical protein HYPDE_27923 [Hyphomicrobium denitrificans 1NES1]|uniref:Uncharacterized protein n=1 Tax=Hyphomicrobium denitrificans 1NES1 TaxID=670307 RepID=N0B1A4_9HYPH|nr:hypothetical protein HYPDE_27923 [Hyphomicrobium denitrificans 1NES1]